MNRVARATRAMGGLAMGIRVKVLLCSLALAVATLATAGAAGLNLETATIADLNAAFASGALTSEKLVEART